MAKKAKSGEEPSGNGKASGGEETTAGYFRKVFKESPRLLGERSNEKLLQRWLADHPGETEVPKSVKANLANLKSVLRSQKRRKVAGRKQESQPVGEEAQVATVPTGATELEGLEHQIDECLTTARTLDRDGLDSIISLLRKARNEVVWKIGQ